MKEQKKVNPLATESEGKLIAKFAIPAIISMLVSSLYNIVDQIFIGQGVGLLGNAATNIAFPVSIICTATALLLGIGSASNFNLCSGAGDHTGEIGRVLFLPLHQKMEMHLLKCKPPMHGSVHLRHMLRLPMPEKS